MQWFRSTFVKIFQVSINFTHYQGARVDYIITSGIEDLKQSMRIAPD